jgi:hypothetical protein
MLSAHTKQLLTDPLVSQVVIRHGVYTSGHTDKEATHVVGQTKNDNLIS